MDVRTYFKVRFTLLIAYSCVHLIMSSAFSRLSAIHRLSPAWFETTSLVVQLNFARLICNRHTSFRCRIVLGVLGTTTWIVVRTGCTFYTTYFIAYNIVTISSLTRWKKIKIRGWHHACLPTVSLRSCCYGKLCQLSPLSIKPDLLVTSHMRVAGKNGSLHVKGRIAAEIVFLSCEGRKRNVSLQGSEK